MDEAVAKQIHEKVAAVVTWLRTAEEESEEEEDEDDVEVVYTEKASKTGIVTETVPNVSEPVLSGEGLILSIAGSCGGRGGCGYRCHLVQI